MMIKSKEQIRLIRHKRVRRSIKSTSNCPRLCVHRSLKNLYIQVIDDEQNKTLFSFSSLNREIKDKVASGGNIAAAGVLGEEAAKILIQKGITNVVFDRGGYLYHGRIKALAEGLRKGGLVF